MQIENEYLTVEKKTLSVEGRITPEEARLLYTLARDTEANGAIVEIGSFHGYSTIWLASGSKAGSKSTVYAIDPHDTSEHGDSSAVFRKNLAEAGVDDIVVPINKYSSEAAADWNGPVKLLWIDGAHDYDNVCTDFNSWSEFLAEGGIVAFHDFMSLSQPGVTAAVKEYIFDSSQYTVLGCVNTILMARKNLKFSNLDRICNDSAWNLLQPRKQLEDDFQYAESLINELKKEELISLLTSTENQLFNFFGKRYAIIRLMAIGTLYMRAGVQSKAEEVFRKVLSYGVDTPTLEQFYSHLCLGHLMLQKNNYDVAEDEFKSALSVDKISKQHKAEAMHALAKCYLKANRINDAHDLLIEQLNLPVQYSNGQLGTIYYLLGDIYKKNKNNEYAKSCFTKSLDLLDQSDPLYNHCKLNYGYTLYLLNDYSQASKYISEVVFAPNSTGFDKKNALTYLCKCYENIGDALQARTIREMLNGLEDSQPQQSSMNAMTTESRRETVSGMVDSSANCLKRTGMRAAKILESLETLMRIGIPISTIVDVGIQHSTPVLMKVFPHLHHLLFEPVEEYYPFIEKNYENISHTLVQAAVSDLNGELTLHTEKKTRGDEISHSYIVATPTPSSRTVKTLKLDSYFESNIHQPPYLLKIDVEGPDVPAKILSGAKRVLENTSAVVIEMTVDTFVERARLLHESGFDVWDICDLCYYGDCLWQADVVFVKRELKQSNILLRPMHNKPFKPELWQSGF